MLDRDAKLLASRNVSTGVVTQSPADGRIHTAGKRNYEFTNHLANVLLVTSDRRIPIYVATVFNHYEPQILSYSDYYPFGVMMPNRNSNPTSYLLQWKEEKCEVYFHQRNQEETVTITIITVKNGGTFYLTEEKDTTVKAPEKEKIKRRREIKL